MLQHTLVEIISVSTGRLHRLKKGDGVGTLIRKSHEKQKKHPNHPWGKGRRTKNFNFIVTFVISISIQIFLCVPKKWRINSIKIQFLSVN